MIKFYIISPFLFYFLLKTVRSSFINRDLMIDQNILIDPHFEVNQYLDEPFKRKVEEKPEKMIFDLLKGTFDFFSFSLKTISGPISVLSVQISLRNSLKQILSEMENFENYKTFIENVSKKLKKDSSITIIFDPISIDRLIKIFQSYENVFIKIKKENPESFLKGHEIILKVLKWTFKEISSIELEDFDEFLDEILSKPPEIDRFSSDLLDRLSKGRDFIENESKSNEPSTLEIITMIQNLICSDGNFDEISLYFDESVISDLRKQDFNQLRIVLKYSEYEIRKVHDYKVSFEYSLKRNVYKKSAFLELEENFKKFINFSKTTKFPYLGIEFLLKKVFNESKFDFESKEIELISYLIQELSTKDSMILRHCLYGEPYEFDFLKGNVKLTIKNLISILKNLRREEEIEKFLEPIHEFLFNESIENVKKVIRKLSEIFSDEDELILKDEIVYCLELGLGLTGQFPFIKDYVLNNLMGIQLEDEDELYGNPWLRNLTLESMEKLSTVGTRSEKSTRLNDSDDESIDKRDDREVEEERNYFEYMSTFHTIDYDERSSLSLSFTTAADRRSSSQDTAGNVSYFSDYDLFDYSW